jgi:hypothetical protein
MTRIHIKYIGLPNLCHFLFFWYMSGTKWCQMVPLWKSMLFSMKSVYLARNIPSVKISAQNNYVWTDLDHVMSIFRHFDSFQPFSHSKHRHLRDLLLECIDPTRSNVNMKRNQRSEVGPSFYARFGKNIVNIYFWIYYAETKELAKNSCMYKVAYISLYML